MSELYRKGAMPLYNPLMYDPSMGGPNSARWHDEKSLMTFIRKAVDDGLLVPVTEELVTRAEWEARTPAPVEQGYSCPKCGYQDTNVDWVSTSKRLHCECRRCRYWWSEKPKDTALNIEEDA